jgi:hypothetical protein
VGGGIQTQPTNQPTNKSSPRDFQACVREAKAWFEAKFLIYEQRLCGKQDRHMLVFYEVGREETQEKGKILEENAQAAQEKSTR